MGCKNCFKTQLEVLKNGIFTQMISGYFRSIGGR